MAGKSPDGGKPGVISDHSYMKPLLNPPSNLTSFCLSIILFIYLSIYFVLFYLFYLRKFEPFYEAKLISKLIKLRLVLESLPNVTLKFSTALHKKKLL